MRSFVVVLAVSVLVVVSGCVGGSAGRLARLDNDLCVDKTSGVMWQLSRGKIAGSLSEAKQFAAAIEIGGYTDWRLPTIYELYDLSYLVDLHKNGDCDVDVNGNYWADEKDGEEMAGAWEISDQCEPERHYFTKKRGYVRVVRP